METRKGMKSGNVSREEARLKREFEQRINQEILSAELRIKAKVEESIRLINSRIEKIRSLA